MTGMPDSRKFRHELKHLISPADLISLRHRLSAVLPHDPYNPGPYHIRSLYFENPYDKTLREKLDGLEVREKFRIRYYNDDEHFIRLEKKNRVNALSEKGQAKVTKEECMRLLRRDTSWMLKPDEPLLCELHAKMQYQLLRPRVLVDYTREAFVYVPGNVRVTLDSNIRTGLTATDLFNRNVVTLPADPKNPAILEVKYDEFLPEIIRDLVQVRNRHAAAFSKYAACRAYG